MSRDSLRKQFDTVLSTLAMGDTLNHATVGETIRAEPAVSLSAQTSASPNKLPEIALGTAQSESADVTLGTLLGEGGMGQVFLATQRSVNREIAVKLLRPEARTVPNVTALLHEARTTGRLEHPNIVPIHALGLSTEGTPVMLMKRVEGVSWLKLIHSPNDTAWERLANTHAGENRLRAHLDVLLQVCNALEFAHARGVIHRDIKPENVMIGSFGEVYLLDWGIAMRVPVPPREPGQSPHLCGTPSYMAPEMVEGHPDRLDARTDVYLLGATLHEVLTHTPRHDGTAIPQVLLSAFLSEPFAYGPDVPSELAALCNDATQKDPSLRPASVSAFRKRIVDYLSHGASISLSDTAAKSLASLVAIPGVTENQSAALTSPEAWAHMIEARFGYLQSLREWPGNHPARAGLQSVLERMIEREIALKNPAAATTLLRELPTERPDLARRIDETIEQASALARQAELHRKEREQMDIRVAAGARATFVAVITALMVVVLMVFLYVQLVLGPDAVRNRGLWSLVVNSFFVSAIAGVGWIFRKKFFANRINKQISQTFLTSAIYYTVCNGIALVLGADAHTFVTYSLLLLSGFCACSSILLIPAMRWPAVVWFVATVLCVVLPRGAEAVNGVSNLVVVVLLAWLARSGRLKPHGET